MLGVNQRESAASVREWASRIGIAYPLWLDPDGKGPTAFRVPAHPSTILLDRQGRVVARIPGERKWSTPEARRLLEWLIARPSK